MHDNGRETSCRQHQGQKKLFQEQSFLQFVMSWKGFEKLFQFHRNSKALEASRSLVCEFATEQFESFVIASKSSARDEK